MDRASVERVIRDAYAARMRGDVEATCNHFADESSFTIAGAAHASPVASEARGREAVSGALRGIMNAIDFVEHEFLRFVIEGDSAAAHSRVKVRAKTTGEEVETELLDLITVRDGKIVSFRQFCDTALAGKLLGPA